MFEKSSKEILVNNDDDFQRFCDINITTLIKHAPSKKKYARWNQMFFLTKDLSKAIMARFRLCNNFLNNKTEENRALYAKQRNYCVSLLRKTNECIATNLDEKNVTDNKRLRKIVNLSGKWRNLKERCGDRQGFEHIPLEFCSKSKHFSISRF